MGSKLLRSLARQSKSLKLVLIGAYIPAFSILGLIVLARLIAHASIFMLTVDPAAAAGAPTHVPIYMGYLSNLGAMLWCAMSTICFFSYLLVVKERGPGELASFLLYSSILTFMLLLDDLFLVHEILIIYVHIPEPFIFAAYALAVTLYVRRFYNIISKTEFLFLLLAFSFFAISIIADSLPINLPGSTLIEDGSKFLGIVSFLTYYSRTSLQNIYQADAFVDNSERVDERLNTVEVNA